MYWSKKILSIFQKLTNSKKVKDPLKFNDFIKNFNLKFEGDETFNIDFTFSCHEYRMENKYGEYFFYLYFDENQIRVDIIGEEGEEFLTLIYKFESKNIDFVEIETAEIEKQKYLNGIDFYNYDELIKQNKIHHDMTIRDFYLQHLESVLKR